MRDSPGLLHRVMPGVARLAKGDTGAGTVPGAEALDELLDDLGRRDIRLALAKVRTTLRRMDIDHRLDLHAEVRGAVAGFVGHRTSLPAQEAGRAPEDGRWRDSGTPR